MKSVCAAISASAALIATASAGVLTIGGGIATVSCTPSCAGIIGGSVTSAPSLGVTGGTAGSLSATSASLYNYRPSNPANEAAALNLLAGTSFLTGTQTDAGGVESLSFSTTAQWIALKLGAGTFFLKNTSGPVTLLINYVKSSGRAGRGGGFSHYTEFGNAIPLPGAAWLMLAGVAGLGFSSRRKKK